MDTGRTSTATGASQGTRGTQGGLSLLTQGRLKPLTGLLFYAALIILLMITLFPIYWVASTSFKSPLEVYAMPPRWLPGGLYLQNYIAALKGTPVVRYLLNSLVVSLVATGAAVALGSLAAYAFSRYTFRGKDKLFFLILLLRMIPTIVTALPLYIIYSRLGISDTWFGLILAYTAAGIPFVVWIMKGFLQEVPREIDESAWTDGYSRMTTIVKFILPLAAPGLVAVSILTFMLTWNDLVYGLILSSTPAARTMPVGLTTFIWEFEVRWGEMCSLATIMLVPILIFIFLVQRHLVRGLTFGAIKG